MQGTWVRALVREDPTCRGATKPRRRNYWACALEPASHNYWARVPQLLKPTCLEPVLRNKRSHRNEKPTHRNEHPTQPKIKINKFLKKGKRPNGFIVKNLCVTWHNGHGQGHAGAAWMKLRKVLPVMYPRGWLRGLGANNKLVCREVALLVLHGANVLHQAPCLENHLCILNILKINTLYPPKCS